MPTRPPLSPPVPVDLAPDAQKKRARDWALKKHGEQSTRGGPPTISPHGAFVLAGCAHQESWIEGQDEVTEQEFDQAAQKFMAQPVGR